jgi:hypothetical protein
MDHILDAITKRNVIPANVSIPYLDMQGLKAFRAWIFYRDTSGYGIHPGDFDISCLLIFTQSPKQTINQLLHHDRKLAIKRKAAVVVTQTDLIL